VTYASHYSKKSGNTSLKVTYHTGFLTVTEYVTFEGRAKGIGMSWWYKRCAGYLPKSVDEALYYVSQLAVPERIYVTKNGSYDRVSDIEITDVKPMIEEINETNNYVKEGSAG
jgi:hypothetical protein